MITTMLSAKRWKKIILLLGYDSGIGIDPKIMPRLFTKFATKSFQGTGLGYSYQNILQKTMAERYGLRIRRTEEDLHFTSATVKQIALDDRSSEAVCHL